MKRLTAILIFASVQAIALACPSIAFAESGDSADELLREAELATRQIDANQFTTLWQSAAPFVKARLPQPSFIDDMRKAKQSIGPVARRSWASVSRVTYVGNKDLPDGLYANVGYSTALANGAVTTEQVSFRLEGDGRWHITGYIPQPQARKP